MATLMLPDSRKRKHSAVFSMSTPEVSMPTSMSSQSRKGHTNRPLALMSLSDELSNFTDTYHARTAAEFSPRVVSSPERKMMAMECA